MKFYIDNKTGRSLNAKAKVLKEGGIQLRVEVRPCDHAGFVGPIVLGGLLKNPMSPVCLHTFEGWAFSGWCPWCGAIRLRHSESERVVWVEPHQDVAQAIHEGNTQRMLDNSTQA